MSYLEFVGVGAGFSVGLGNTAAIIYSSKSENGFYMLDCGEQARVKIVEKGVFNYLNGVFITHLHGDHIFGLELLGFYWHFVKKEKLKLFIPTESMAKDLMTLLMITMKEIQDSDGKPANGTPEHFFDIDVIGDKSVVAGKESYSFKPVLHVQNKECFAILIENKERKHIYAPDVAVPIFTVDWFKEISGIKYIWHDCQLYNGGKGSVHCFINELKKYSNKNTALIHYNKPPSETDIIDAQKWCYGFVKIGDVFEL